MINRYYAGDVKAKRNSDKDIKVIREEDLKKALEDLDKYLEDRTSDINDYETDVFDTAIEKFLNIKDCFGEEE